MISKILIIESDSKTKEKLAGVITNMGFEVLNTDNINLAYETMKSTEAIVLVICAFELPDFNATEFCKKIKNNTAIKLIPVLIITQNSQQLVESFKAGADDFIFADFTEDILEWKIYALSRFYNAQKENIKLAELKTLHALIAAMNHEFNNVVAIAGCNLELLKNAVNTDSDTQKILNYVNAMESSLHRIRNIIRELNTAIESEAEFDQYVMDTRILKFKKDS